MVGERSTSTALTERAPHSAAARSPRYQLHTAHIVLTHHRGKIARRAPQLERRALAAVAHDGCRDVARAIDLPVPDRRA